MWASFALATVFVAVFQGTGLEVLIFCAFSATFFLAACTVSLCRRPRDLMVEPPLPNMAIEHTPRLDGYVPHHQHQQTNHLQPQLIGQQQPSQNQNILEMPITETAAPPPPYHIAILLPENSKEADESPPPSYDKLVI